MMTEKDLQAVRQVFREELMRLSWRLLVVTLLAAGIANAIRGTG